VGWEREYPSHFPPKATKEKGGKSAREKEGKDVVPLTFQIVVRPLNSVLYIF